MSRVNLKISVSGVRGVIGESLTPSLIMDFAAAFGEYVGGGRVAVGRDTRPTGPMLEHAVVAGLLSVGCQPLLTGIVPTPAIQVLVDDMKANGGIAISASHNPPEWNALKFIGRSAVFLNATEASELLDVYNQPDRQYVPEEEYRTVRRMASVISLLERRIDRVVNTDRIRAAGFKVAMDCCNGVGAYYSVDFLHGLGCDVVPLNDERDGLFRRSPEPLPEHLSALCETVVREGCDIGFAQDPDGDRLAIVGPDGVPLGEQQSIVLAAEHVLSKTPGPVVVNVQTTKAVEDVAARYGCTVHRAPVSEIDVVGAMYRVGAVLGGEGNCGGIICPAVHSCRDSFTGMALILELLAERQRGLTDLMADLPVYAQGIDKLKCPGSIAVRAVHALAARYADRNPDVRDGLRMPLDNGWVSIRPSRTEAVIRVFAEAPDHASAKALSDRMIGECRDIVEPLNS